MIAKTIKIIDRNRKVVATGQVVNHEDRFTGQIDLHSLSTSLRQTFEEYEEIVNDQMFSLLDEIEEQINALRLKVIFNEGDEAGIEDLQIYPTTKRIAFKLVKDPVELTVKEVMVS